MNDRRPEAIGERLRITREALRLSQTAFCGAADLSASAHCQ
jgi:transcriptional regulator with XRE-family HTH domain